MFLVLLLNTNLCFSGVPLPSQIKHGTSTSLLSVAKAMGLQPNSRSLRRRNAFASMKSWDLSLGIIEVASCLQTIGIENTSTFETSTTATQKLRNTIWKNAKKHWVEVWAADSLPSSSWDAWCRGSSQGLHRSVSAGCSKATHAAYSREACACGDPTVRLRIPIDMADDSNLET